jgi:hypothetical protein
LSKHAGRECPRCGKLMSKPLVHEIRRNAPALRYWACKDCGAEWTSDAPEVERNKEVDGNHFGGTGLRARRKVLARPASRGK